MAKAAIAIEDIRAVQPVACIRATGLRPEDSFGFLPIQPRDLGVAGRGSPVFEEPKITVERDRWPREKVGKRGCEPDDSYGFCPDFDNSAIYFARRNR